MSRTLLNVVLSGITASLLLSVPAMAQIPNDPGHPRVNEVDNRINHQEQRIQNGENSGKINGHKERRDQHRINRVERREHRDMAKHNGHLTHREQRHLNRELNHNSKRIHNQKH